MRRAAAAPRLAPRRRPAARSPGSSSGSKATTQLVAHARRCDRPRRTTHPHPALALGRWPSMPPEHRPALLLLRPLAGRPAGHVAQLAVQQIQQVHGGRAVRGARTLGRAVEACAAAAASSSTSTVGGSVAPVQQRPAAAVDPRDPRRGTPGARGARLGPAGQRPRPRSSRLQADVAELAEDLPARVERRRTPRSAARGSRWGPAPARRPVLRAK